MDLCAKYHPQGRENGGLVRVVTAEKREPGAWLKDLRKELVPRQVGSWFRKCGKTFHIHAV